MQSNDALRPLRYLRGNRDVDDLVSLVKLTAFLTFPHLVHLAIATIQIVCFATLGLPAMMRRDGSAGLDESSYRREQR
jgi:hypothetical protein